MKEVDYIVVGLGLAGIAFCEQLVKHNKSFIVFDNSSQKSSQIAAGVYNPVVLKRFTPAWRGQLQMEKVAPFYSHIENRINIKIDHELPILRKFNSIEEQNNWFAAADHPQLENFLSLDLIENKNQQIDAPLGFGLVHKTGRINTRELFHGYKRTLLESNRFRDEKFQHEAIKFESGVSIYKDLKSKFIVFAEGYGIKNNPFFNNLPLVGNKGEVLIIRAMELNLKAIIKSSIFLVPFSNEYYYVGATYDRDDKTLVPTEGGRDELLAKLKTLIRCEFEVIEHKAGIRPTVRDRRPLVGTHTQYGNLAILNGLGTRGVMISPYISEQLYKHLEHGKPLDEEIDIKRFQAV